MREVRLKADKVVNIDKIITEEFINMQTKDYYRKVINTPEKKVYVYVYEYAYKTFEQVKYFSRMPGTIIVTTTILASVKKDSTVVAFILSDDDDFAIKSSMILALQSYGFYIVDTENN